MKKRPLIILVISVVLAVAGSIYLTQTSLGDCQSSRETQKRVDACSAIIERNPQNADAYLARSLAREALNQKKEALSDLSISIQLAPTVAKYVSRASKWDKEDELDKAIWDYETALKMEPEDKVFKRTFLSRQLATLVRERSDRQELKQYANGEIRCLSPQNFVNMALNSSLLNRAQSIISDDEASFSRDSLTSEKLVWLLAFSDKLVRVGELSLSSSEIEIERAGCRYRLRVASSITLTRVRE